MAEMIMDGIIALNKAKKYTAESLDGLGALRGANCVIESIDTVPEGNRVTFSWTGTDGTIETSTMIVENGIDGNDGTNGADGVGISKIEKIDTVGLKDTYRITFTDNTTYDYSVTNGQKGEQGIQGLRGEKGEQGEQGVQGIQGIQGEKGDDGYPFLIYKEYSDVSKFNKNDFPEIGLMFMIVADDATSFPVYRYTGDESVPYRYVTDLTGGEGIKGDKGDKGDKGEQGVQGINGKDGITYTPIIGTVISGDIASATVVVDDKTSTAEFSFVLPKGDNIAVDTILSNTSENPVQNKVIKQAIDNKADKTVATTSTDGLMSAEDKDKLDAFEITTTGGKLHDKDIAVKDDIPTSLPANGGNADTVDGKHASDFIYAHGYFDSIDLNDIKYPCSGLVLNNCIHIPSNVWGTLLVYAGGTGSFTQIYISTEYAGIPVVMYFRHYDDIGWSDWKEISTTPIKSTTFSTTSDETGNFTLLSANENKVPISIKLDNKPFYVVPFLYNNQLWMGSTISETTRQPVANVDISGTVYYIEE